MVKVVDALFDGKVFHPLEPVALEPNTQVKLQVEFVPGNKKAVKSFLQTARSLNLDGPPDWSENLDHYLYDEASDSE
jgi:predicted DNA-binding antitoxin AbrB/MazE fold protein